MMIDFDAMCYAVIALLFAGFADCSSMDMLVDAPGKDDGKNTILRSCGMLCANAHSGHFQHVWRRRMGSLDGSEMGKHHH
jgi:hypothetical protein